MKAKKIINYLLITKVLGMLMVLLGVAILSALPFSYFFNPAGINDIRLFSGQTEFFPILLSGIITIVIGGVAAYLARHASKSIGKKEGYIIVTVSWVLISLFGSLPFYLSGYFPSFTDAFFETMSGFTTTGASILNDIESIPKGLLFWRSMTHWIGGMGIIVLSLAILPLLGIGGMQLFSAESPGPTADKIHPKVQEMAKRLWGIYVLLTVVETALLMLGEMGFFDAVCHAFATMATGGFSTQNASIANYSAYTQYIIILFMILAGTNFAVHFYALNRQFKKIRYNEEFRFYLTIIAIVTFIITIGLLYSPIEIGVEKAFRDSLFQVVAIITTTGFVSADYLLWPTSVWIFLLLLFFVGGSAGSTGGGVKVVRILVLIKNSFLEFKRLMHPKAIIPVRVSRQPVPQSVVFVVMSFFLLYVLTFAVGTVVMSFTGLDFISSMGASASCVGNVGPAFGSLGPVSNYANVSDIGKWILSFLMLLGRLELLTVLILFSPTFWKR